MADQQNIGCWLRERLQASLAIEAKDPAELLDWLEARRKDVPFSAELIPLREVAGWQHADNGNIGHVTGQFFRIEGVRVRSAPGLREIAGWDQPILTQSDGGPWRCCAARRPAEVWNFCSRPRRIPAI